MNRLRPLSLLLPAILLWAPPARGEDPPSAPAPADAPPAFVVAVLDFDGPKEVLRELTASVPQVVEARLSESPQIRLVTRADLGRIQEEQALSLAGLVAEGQGARVGQLVGADILVVGRVSSVDEEVLISAKAIGAATGAFLPVLVRGGADVPGGELAGRLADRLKETLLERVAEVLPAADGAESEREAQIRTRLAELDVKLPRLALLLRERHLQSAPAPDPAAETAMLATLVRLGFSLAPIARAPHRAWLERAAKGEADFPAPSDLAADLAIVGEAFSEYGGRVGRFVSCRARVELRVYRTSTGEVVATWTGTGSGTDLSEIFAAKKALDLLGRRGAHELALDLARSAPAR
jgi:hypothetical protein